MKPNRANCDLERDFSSPCSPISVDLRYPVMESNEGPCGQHKVTDLQGTLEKSFWQSSSNGRDIKKFTFKNKDEINLQLQKRIVEHGFGNELIIENLEQCTEDHDCDLMSRGFANEDQCHEESEYEETEHKLFLAGGIGRSNVRSDDYHLAPEVDEKSDVEKEKEKGEKDGAEKEYYGMDEEEKEVDENEIINKDVDEKEADEKEKMENEEVEKQMSETGTEKDSDDKTEILDYYSRAEMAPGETIIDSGFFEMEVLMENGQLGLIDRSEVIEIEAGLEGEEYAMVADPVQMEHGLTRLEMKERSALVLTLDSHPKDPTSDFEMSGNDDSLLPAINSPFTGVSPLSIEEELSGSCMDSDVIRREKLQKQLEGALIATGAEIVPSDIRPMRLFQNVERKWKNISNSTISRMGQEPGNGERCRGGSGDKSEKSSQGNCENDDGISQQTACGSSKEACLSMACNPSSGGSGGGCGGGDEDGDKWKKEDFRFSDNADEKKTKQEKELKKKSRLEKGDLCSHVSYGDKEKLVAMALEWGERSELIRDNALLGRRCTEGVILDSNKNEFFINNNCYQEGVGYEKAIGSLSPLRVGTSGKCYPCYDFETGKTFCIKEIQLSNFYDSEITTVLDLDNPGIVKLYGAIFSDDKVYILQELICGSTLQEVIETNEKLDCPTALEYMRQLLEILDYLDRCGVIHDDIKADNIMCRPDSNSIVLIDFGLAKKTLHVQKDTIPFGSECAMSPEKAASEGYDAKADVWAATTVLVHMLSGDVPWTIKERSPPLEDVPPDCPEPVQSLIKAGWIVDAHGRPSASQLLTHEAFQLLDILLPSDELLPKFNSTDELATLGTFNLEEDIMDFHEEDLEDGEALIMEAEKLLSANIGAINFDNDKTPDNLECVASTNSSLLGQFEAPEEVFDGSLVEYSDDQKRSE